MIPSYGYPASSQTQQSIGINRKHRMSQDTSSSSLPTSTSTSKIAPSLARSPKSSSFSSFSPPFSSQLQHQQLNFNAYDAGCFNTQRIARRSKAGIAGLVAMKDEQSSSYESLFNERTDEINVKMMNINPVAFLQNVRNEAKAASSLPISASPHAFRRNSLQNATAGPLKFMMMQAQENATAFTPSIGTSTILKERSNFMQGGGSEGGGRGANILYMQRQIQHNQQQNQQPTVVHNRRKNSISSLVKLATLGALAASAESASVHNKNSYNSDYLSNIKSSPSTNVQMNPPPTRNFSTNTTTDPAFWTNDNNRALTLMSSIISKLQAMSYEHDMTLSISGLPNASNEVNSVHFVIPFAECLAQFLEFVRLCYWLVFVITNSSSIASEMRMKVDSNLNTTSVANDLLLVLHSLGFSSSEGITAAKVKKGCGVEVCEVLEFLTDKAVEKRGSNKGSLLVRHGVKGAIGETNIEDEDEDEVEDDTELELDEGEREEECESPVASSNRIISPTVNPAEWRIELERLATKICLTHSVNNGNQWREHISQSNLHKANITNEFRYTDNKLEVLSLRLCGIVETVKSGEKKIDRSHEEVRSQYESVSAEYIEYANTVARRESKVNELAAILEDLKDEIIQVKDELDKCSNSATDTKPLISIKNANVRLRQECRELNCLLGVLSEQVLSGQVGEM